MFAKLLWALATMFGVFGMASVSGAIASAAASYQDYTAGGGVTTFPLGAGISAATLINKGPCRLQSVLVTTSAAQSWVFYDTTNTVSQTGATIIGYVAASAAAGTLIRFQMPALKGIVAVPSGAGAAVTVSFN